MIPFGIAEAMGRAFELRADLGLGSDLCAADTVVTRAIQHAGLDAVALPQGDPILSHALGVLDRQMGSIWYRQDLAGQKKSHLLAHEVGHWFLHHGQSDIPDGDAEVLADWRRDHVMSEVDGYSPVQRREMEANAFAAEILAPVALVSDAFLGGSSAKSIASALGVEERLVVGQLVLGVLMAFVPSHSDRDRASSGLGLDADQTAAARSPEYRTLALAGPGSGKTRALAGRVAYLLESGYRPQRILALTFSRNAAEELRRRMSRAVGPAATSLSTYTIHGFGLELLRRFGHHVGLSPNPHIVDRVGSVRIIERIMSQGIGGDLEYLDAPIRPIAEVADAIASWKERGVNPRDALSSACSGNALADAARIYELYEARLRSLDAVDFADLIALTVAMLSKCPEALATVRSEYDHVLVDEIQDVDTLSWELVELTVGSRARLWAVGDTRQAIYAFRGGRGCANSQVDVFDHVHRLRLSYRCGPQIAAFVNALSRRLGLSDSAGLESVGTEPDGPIIAAHSADEVAELDEIAAHLDGMLQRLGPECRQAVLCRTNGQAREIAEGLQLRGVRVIGPAGALDVSAVRHALSAMALAARRSLPGRVSVVNDVVRPDMMDARDPIEFLGRWLFGETGAARGLVGSSLALDRWGLLWLWRMAAGVTARLAFNGRNGDSRGLGACLGGVVSDVRRAMAVGDDRLIADRPEEPSEAVAVMTIHASKGLEFDVVVVPRVNVGHFPPRSRPRSLCLMPDERDAGEHDADEARLLYVAASRARRSFAISCCASLGGRKATPSPLFDAAKDAVAAVAGAVCEWSGYRRFDPLRTQAPDRAGGTTRTQPPGRIACSQGALETYSLCPKRYWFEQEGVRADLDIGPYVVYVNGMREALRAMRVATGVSGDALREAAIRKWDDVWSASSAARDWTPMYRMRAEEAINVAARNTDWRTGEADIDLPLALENGTIRLRADRIECQGDERIVVERFIWRRRRKNTPGSARARLLYAAAKSNWPNAEIRLQDRYMVTGEVVPLEQPKDGGAGAMARTDRILRNIQLGLFDPKPGDQCAYCPYLLQCDRGTSPGPGIQMNIEDQEYA